MAGSVNAARQRAERCFALARSTTFEGERDAAIARGIAVAEKAGLNLDTFDIPGRKRAGPTIDYGSPIFTECVERYRAAKATGGFHPTSVRDAEDELMARAADAGSGFAAAFMRGRFAAAMREKTSREARRERWPDIEACKSYLFSRGVPVYDFGLFPDDDGPRWYVPGRDPDRVTDDGLRSTADAVSGLTT